MKPTTAYKKEDAKRGNSLSLNLWKQKKKSQNETKIFCLFNAYVSK